VFYKHARQLKFGCVALIFVPGRNATKVASPDGKELAGVDLLGYEVWYPIGEYELCA
jgi:hypothetical protein